MSLIVIPIFYYFPKEIGSYKKLSYLLLAIIIGFAANSIGVAFTSQSLLGYNFPDINKKETVAICEDWVNKLYKSNIRVHLVPIIFSIILLGFLVLLPWNGNKILLCLFSIIVPFVMFIIWVCIPIPKVEGSKEYTNPLNKVKYVYNNPNFGMQISMPICIIITVVLYVFIMRGKIDKTPTF